MRLKRWGVLSTGGEDEVLLKVPELREDVVLADAAGVIDEDLTQIDRVREFFADADERAEAPLPVLPLQGLNEDGVDLPAPLLENIA